MGGSGGGGARRRGADRGGPAGRRDHVRRPGLGHGVARLECNPRPSRSRRVPGSPFAVRRERRPAGVVVPPGDGAPGGRRPFILLDDYTAAPAGDPVAVEFRQYVNRAVAGHPDWGYSPADAVVQFARSGKKYLTSAIADVDKQVTRAAR